MNGTASYQGKFDYAKMAQEALREQKALQAILAKRKAEGPSGAEQVLVWQRDNRMLYTMYLEQRANVKLFTARHQRDAGPTPQVGQSDALL